VVVRNAKTTEFPGGDGLFPKRGVGTKGSIMRISTRKVRSLWANRPQTTPKNAASEPNDAQKC
jgi:hypothetical protein